MCRLAESVLEFQGKAHATRNQVKIVFKPLGNVAGETMGELNNRVGDSFRCPIKIEAGLDDLTQAYSLERKQHLSSTLLAALGKAGRDERVVGIADVDLYVPRLNFVFGEADMTSGTAVVSLYRLRPEYHGSAPDEVLFLERATKEIVHELGHTFGLRHCPNPRCAMHFSNSLADTDVKGAHFCSECRPKIIA
jgi:archaemetzincin